MNDLEIKRNYDLFSKEIPLYFRGSDYYSTLFGRIATVAYIILYFILFVYFTFLGLLKRNGTFNSHETITQNLPNLTLNKDNLYFTFSLEDPDTYDNFIDDEIYYTEAYYKHGKRVGENWIWEQNKLETGPCEIEYFGDNYKELLKSKPYKYYSCIKNLNQSLFGNFVYDDYSLIYIQFFPCVNDSTRHCKPQEVIDKYLNGTFVDFQIQSVLINYENYKNPVKANFEDVYTTVGRGFKLEMHLHFQLINFEDYGYFGEKIGGKQYVQYDFSNPMITLNSDLQKNESLCDVTLKLSDKTLIVKRQYTTIMEIGSKIGGIMELILKVITTLSFLFVSSLFDVSVINELFQFHKNKKETIHKGIKKQNFFRGETIGNGNKDSNSNSKAEFKNLRPAYKDKKKFDTVPKYSKNDLNAMSNKNNNIENSLINNLNSKDHILNNIISSIPNISSNSNDKNNNDIIADLNRKYNLDKKDNMNNNEIKESKIIKIKKLNPFTLLLFSLFPNKLTNININLIKMGLCKFREELDVTKLFKMGLLNNRTGEILKNNSILLSFDKDYLDINTYRLYIEE